VWRRSAAALGLLLALAGCSGGHPREDAPTTTATTTVVITTTTTAVPLTTVAPRPLRHVFPLDPPSVADYSQGHHDYPAVDIFCPIGTRVVAVTDGVVDFVSRTDPWDPAVDDPATRGGLSVALVGDDGVRYYGSHLSAVADGIEPGVRVTAGQLLGRSGRSGNAAGTDPHLHFGISHPTTPDDWQVRRGEVDPYPYLVAWEAGGNPTPDLSGVGG